MKAKPRRQILYADGRIVDLPGPVSVEQVAELIGAETLDCIMLGDGVTVMMLDDNGLARGLPENYAATILYRARTRCGEGSIVGDVVIAPDGEYGQTGVWWVETGNPTGKNFPKWLRSAAMTDDGTVFLPAQMADSENRMALCAGYDGIRVIHDSGHLYVPAKWLAKEFPEWRELCERIEAIVRRELGKPEGS